MTQRSWQQALQKLNRVSSQARLVEQDSALVQGRASRWQDVGAAMAALPLEHRSGGAADALDEVRRICGLDIQRPLTEDELEAFRREHTKSPEALAKVDDVNWKWKAEQAEAVLAYIQCDGAYLPLAVGVGKTIVLQRIADIAYKAGKRKIVHILPGGLIDQFMSYDIKYAKDRIPYDVPVLDPLTGDMGPKKRTELARSNAKGTYLLPFSILSREASADILELIQPDVILVDESFLLANFTSAIVKRVERYVSTHDVQFVGAAGSITKTSIVQFAHLVKWALKRKSPLPLLKEVLAAWAGAVDTGAMPEVSGTTLIRPLMGWAHRAFPTVQFHDDVSGFRKAVRLRMVTSPGIVSTSGTRDIQTSITYVNSPVPNPESYPGWCELEALVERVIVDGIAPTGDPCPDKMIKFRWLNELSAGIYNDLWWPRPEELAQRRGVSVNEAAERIHEGQEHLIAKRAFDKWLGTWLEQNPNARGSNGRPVDSELLVTKELSAHGIDFLPAAGGSTAELYYLWQGKKAKERPFMAERDRGVVRVCDYKLRHAARWAASLPAGEGSIIWATSRGVVKWLAEILAEELGPDRSLYCPRGMQSELRLESNGHLHKACSLHAYYKGLNLQFHKNMLYVQFPRDAMKAEQSVGRIHRTGQKALHLDINMMLTTQHDRDLFSACLVDALYQHQIGGGDQKLIYGSYNPPLEAVDPSVLEQKGLIDRGMALDQDHRRLLREKFGRR